MCDTMALCWSAERCPEAVSARRSCQFTSLELGAEAHICACATLGETGDTAKPRAHREKLRLSLIGDSDGGGGEPNL